MVNLDDAVVAKGDEGELLIAGDGVMQGYWDLGGTDRSCICRDQWRALVPHRETSSSSSTMATYEFHGRKDRMVKKRGYRVELGEIEVSLYQHPDVREAAVIAVPGPGGLRRTRSSRHT